MDTVAWPRPPHKVRAAGISRVERRDASGPLRAGYGRLTGPTEAPQSTDMQRTRKAGEMASAHCRSSLYGEFYEKRVCWNVGRCSSEDNAACNSFAATVAVSARRFPFRPIDAYIDPAPAIFVNLPSDLQGPERLQRRDWTGLSSRSQSGAWSLCWLIAQSRQSTSLRTCQ